VALSFTSYRARFPFDAQGKRGGEGGGKKKKEQGKGEKKSGTPQALSHFSRLEINMVQAHCVKGGGKKKRKKGEKKRKLLLVDLFVSF